MKLKKHFYELVEFDIHLQVKLQTSYFRSLDIDQIAGMAINKHEVFTRPEVAKIIKDHYNEIHKTEKDISIMNMFQSPLKQTL